MIYLGIIYCVVLTENTKKGNLLDGCSVELFLEGLTSYGCSNGTRTMEIK